MADTVAEAMGGDANEFRTGMRRERAWRDAIAMRGPRAGDRVSAGLRFRGGGTMARDMAVASFEDRVTREYSAPREH